MNDLDESLRLTIEEKLDTLNALRPLPSATIQKIQEKLKMEMVYHSSAIDGNSLTFKETQSIIHEGITTTGNPLSDHHKAKNHYAALNHLYTLTMDCRKDVIMESYILSLHQQLVQDTDKEGAGCYRKSPVTIDGVSCSPPDATDIPKCMGDLVLWANQNKSMLHTIELVARFHHKLLGIHPFSTGNEPTARLVMNNMLMRAGYPLVIIQENERKTYDTALSNADKGSYVDLTNLIAVAVIRSLDTYLKTLTPSNQ